VLIPNVVLDQMLAARVSSHKALNLWWRLRFGSEGLSVCGFRFPHSAGPRHPISPGVALPAGRDTSVIMYLRG